MNYYQDIDALAHGVSCQASALKTALIYAPNTTGKTRLAQRIKDEDPEGVILYSASVEDIFTWDSKRVILQVNPSSELMNIIESQGLENDIVKNFQLFANDSIEPTINFESGDVSFGFHRGDERSADGIKVSRAEESIFVWCVYYTVLSAAIETLKDDPSLRLAQDYNDLTLAVIDDPVSSMDDARIVTVALAVVELVNSSSTLNLSFVIMTHHALFFNVLFNAFRYKKDRKSFTLHRRLDGWELKSQSSDTPFSYHLGVITDIREAIETDTITRTHFNQFRALLEKTANFLGREGGWGSLLTGPDAKLLTKVLNLYSHDRFADVDASQVSTEYVNALKGEFVKFLGEFKWGVPN